ncbi:MAG: DUF929 family protein [Thermoplasmata archaeon]
MVNWREVERLRARGLDWESVAGTASVQFTPPDGVEDAGRALKALYLTRKSQRSRSSRGASIAAEEEDAAQAPTRRRSSRLLIVGLFLLAASGIWSVIALAFPAPYGILVAFLPDLLVGLILAAILLAAAFLLGVSDLRGSWMKPVAVGIVIGLIGVGLSGYVASQEGFLSLQPGTSYGNGFQQAANSLWTENGRPVVFFMGSAACPYCSATSWAIRGALNLFGGLSGTGYTTSAPDDSAGPNTPEVTLYGSTLGGTYLTWLPAEAPDNQVIQQPALTPAQQSYLSAYDSGGSIPFLVFGGIFMHVGTLVDPASLTTGGSVGTTPYTPAQVNGQLQNQSGPAYSAIIQFVYLIAAYCAKIDELAHLTPPGAVMQIAQVQSDLQQIP